MTARADIMQGTLDLMVLRTLETMGPLHGWGIAQRLEQVSDDALRVNQGTLYPALLRLEQRRLVRSRWGTSDNNRRARFYSITAAGRRQLDRRTAAVAAGLRHHQPSAHGGRVTNAHLPGLDLPRRRLASCTVDPSGSSTTNSPFISRCRRARRSSAVVPRTRPGRWRLAPARRSRSDKGRVPRPARPAVARHAAARSTLRAGGRCGATSASPCRPRHAGNRHRRDDHDLQPASRRPAGAAAISGVRTSGPRSYESAPGTPTFPVTPYSLLVYRHENRTLAGIAGFTREDLQLAIDDRPERLRGLQVSSNYFDVLGFGPRSAGRSHGPKSAPTRTWRSSATRSGAIDSTPIAASWDGRCA